MVAQPFVPLFPKWGICRFHTVSNGRVTFCWLSNITEMSRLWIGRQWMSAASSPFGCGDEAKNTTTQVSPVLRPTDMQSILWVLGSECQVASCCYGPRCSLPSQGHLLLYHFISIHLPLFLVVAALTICISGPAALSPFALAPCINLSIWSLYLLFSFHGWNNAGGVASQDPYTNPTCHF